MALSYQAKQDILNYMANPKNWTDVFDADWFLDEQRKWPTKILKGITLKSSPKNTDFVIEHHKTDAKIYLMLDKPAGLWKIRDESGNDAKMPIGHFSEHLSEPLPHIDPAFIDTIKIPDTSLKVLFDEKGRKQILHARSGLSSVLDAPSKSNPSKLYEGRYFYQIAFNIEDWQTYFDDWDNFAPPSVNGFNLSKLILGHDLGVEPGLDAMNTIDIDLAKRYIRRAGKINFGAGVLDALGDIGKQMTSIKIARAVEAQQRGTANADIQKPWVDTTEFNGHFVAVPKHFASHSHRQEFSLRTELDDREKVWAFGHIFKHASKYPNAISMQAKTMKPRALFDTLASGHDVEDHRGTKWMYRLFETKQSGLFARNIRDVFNQNLRLPTQSFFAVNYDGYTTLAAVRSDEIEGFNFDTYAENYEEMEKQSKNLTL